LRNNFYQERFVVSYSDISRRMAYKLRLTAALSRKKAECDHFPLPQIKTASCVIIAEAVCRKPVIYVTALLWT
jgi:hypothetical protein